MAKVKIFSIGKTKEAWLNKAIEEYSRRLGPILSIEWQLAKTDEQLIHLLSKEKTYIALDPKGQQLTSEAFSSRISALLELVPDCKNLCGQALRRLKALFCNRRPYRAG